MNASIMLKLGIPDKYAMERGGWITTHTLKKVYQHTFSDERIAVDDKIDSYFEEIMQHEMQHDKKIVIEISMYMAFLKRVRLPYGLPTHKVKRTVGNSGSYLFFNAYSLFD